MNIFLDTNVIFKLYHEESGSEKISEFIYRNKDELVLTISDLSKIELHSTFLKRFRKNELTLQELNKIFQLIEMDLENFNIVTVDQTIKDIGLQLLDEIGLKFGLTTLDSLQLAVAIYSNDYFKIDYFVSSDKKLNNIAKEFFEVFNPETS